MPTHRRPILLLALLAGLLPAGSCRRPPQPPPEFRLGLILNEGDPYRAILGSAELAVAQANEAGGVAAGDRQLRVVLTVEGDGGTAEGAAAAARRLINVAGVAAIVGPNWSSRAIPAAAVAEEAGIPLVSPGSTHPDLTAGRRYAFRVGFVDQDQGAAMARATREELGLGRAAVLYDLTDPYSRSLAEAFRTTFVALGGAVVADEAYTSDATDYGPQLRRIRDARADALFLPSYPVPVIAQARQARALGIDATLLGGDGWDEEMMGDTPELEGGLFADHWHPDAGGEPSRAYAEAYERARGTKARSSMGPLTHDAFGLLFAAARREGSAEPEALRRGLATGAPYPGATGMVSYEGGPDPKKAVAVVRLRGGRGEFVRWAAP